MGGVSAIPIKPGDGYRRSAPPPILRQPVAVVLNGGKLFGVLARFLAVRLTYRQQVANPVVACTAQDRQAVVDKQGARRIKAEILLQGEPELLVLLGETVVVGADQAVEERRELDPFQLQ